MRYLHNEFSQRSLMPRRRTLNFLTLCCVTQACCLLVGPVSTARAQVAKRPNILLIMADDLNNDLGCYGHQIVKSPNIDRLAARGARFDRAYCQFPLCNPSRVSLLSGRRPDTTGIMDLDTPPRTYLSDIVFLPQLFRRSGYPTAHMGKIFHTGPAFEDPASWDFEIRETGKHPPDAMVVRSKKLARPPKNTLELAVLTSTDAETADGLVARQASDMLDEYSRGERPFFLAVGFRRPHAPYAAPQKYFDLYPPQQIPPLEEPVRSLERVPTAALTYPKGAAPPTTAERQEFAAAYYACVSFVDAQIGTVLDAVERLKLWDNTVIVFCSDHGYHLGEHGGLWHKMSIFEQSARVPLIVAGPKVAPGLRRQLVELVDIYPTLVEMCGLQATLSLEGKSLVPVLADANSVHKDAAFSQVQRGSTENSVMGRSVRTDRWRYTEWDGGRQGAELYDHDADPGEYFNVVDDEKLTKQREQLRELLKGPAKPTQAAAK